MSKVNEEKAASNFELNVMKIGKNRFQLKKGDQFSSNGSFFNYNPMSPENKGKGHYRRFSGRADSISAKKYQKDVERADNIKLIKDDPYYTGDDPRANEPYNVRSRIRVWEVQYAYEQPVDEEEPLVSMLLELDMYGKQVWKFVVDRHPIDRNTKETYFLKKNVPVSYLSRFPKTDLNTPKGGNHRFYIVGEFSDYNDLEEKLFKFAEAAQYTYIQNAKDLLAKEEKNLSKFLEVKKSQGF